MAFVSVGVLCLFWRKTHTKGLRARLPTRPEEDEERKVPESAEETSRQNRAEQSTELKKPVGRTG